MSGDNRSEKGDSGEPLILVCNDDGIQAPGIHALAEALCDFGEVIVAAPLEEQSAVGHAITTRNPVRVSEWEFPVRTGRITAYAVTGTPADCVKIAMDKLLPRPPSLVVSGINQGPNAAVNVIYSGTVSAATEACILGIPAVAISLCRWDSGAFQASARVAGTIAGEVLESGLPAGVLLNVNVPDLPYDELRGIAVTRQARSKWEESFYERTDPFNRPYYWLSGTFVNMDGGDDTDLEAIENGYVSVTPLQHDLTAHAHLAELRRRYAPAELSQLHSSKTNDQEAS